MPEVALRRELDSRGLRYRIQFTPIAGLRRTVDVAFTRARVAVFVDGCSWHRCPVHASMPKSNSDWWAAKVERNVRRDEEMDRRLAEAGWETVRVWEHEVASVAADDIERLVRCRTGRRVE
jgi:DNA mismatch endonuclease (patch repair protein)